MAKLLLIHAAQAVGDHEGVARWASDLRARGEQVVCSWELLGVGGGFVVALEAASAWADRILLVDPSSWLHAWGTRGRTPSWQRSLQQRIEQAIAASFDQYAVILSPSRATLSPAGRLARLPRFVLPTEAAQLDTWIAGARHAPGWPDEQLEQIELPDRVRPCEVLLDVIDAVVERALGAARERGQIVWIRGAMGTGKSVALAAWQRRTKLRIAASYVARPEAEWTCDPERALIRIARGLADDIASPAWAVIAAPREQPAIVLIDGFEHVWDRLTPAMCERIVEQREIPAGIVAILVSRRLSAQPNGFAPSIDLDRAPWIERRRVWVELMTERAELGPLAEQVRTRAAGNPGLAAALIDELRLRPPIHDAPAAQQTEAPLALPSAFGEGLERSWTSMLAPLGDRRGALISALAVLCAAGAALPRRLLELALTEPEFAALDRASEWLHEDGELLGFVHPGIPEFLAAELGDAEAAHARLFDATIAVRREVEVSPAVQAYVDAHARAHRLMSSGAGGDLAWVLDLERLTALAEHGQLVQRLALALDTAGLELASRISIMRDVADRHMQQLRDDPGSLAGRLWTELVARGIPATWVREHMLWGDRLPAIRLRNRLLVPDLSTRVFMHEDQIRACAIDAAGKRVLTGTSDGRVYLWSVETGSLLADFDVDRWVEGLGLSADGRTGVVGAGPRVILFDLENEREIARHEAHGADVGGLAISADGQRVLSTDEDGQVILWRVAAGRQDRLGSHDSEPRVVAITPDGRVGMSGDEDERSMIWDLEAGVRRHVLTGHEYDVGGVALSSDGRIAASVCIGHGRIWDAHSGELLHKHGSMGMSARAAALVADGTELIVAEFGERVRRFRVKDGSLIYEYTAHTDDMHGLAATADGEWVVTGSEDRSARVWQHSKLLAAEHRETRGVSALAPAGDGRSFWMSAADGGAVRLRLDDGTQLDARGSGRVQGVVERNGCLALVGSSREVVVFDLATQATLAQWSPTSDWLRAVAVEPDGQRLAYAGDDKTVYCSDFAGGDCIELSGASDWVRDLAWAAPGRLLAIDDDGGVRLWDVDRERCAWKGTPFGEYGLHALAVDAQGRRAAVAGSAAKIAILQVADGKQLHTLEGHEGTVRGLCWAHGDRVLISVGDDATLRVWDAEDGRERGRFVAPFGMLEVIDVGGTIVAADGAGNWLAFELDWDRLSLTPVNTLH